MKPHERSRSISTFALQTDFSLGGSRHTLHRGGKPRGRFVCNNLSRQIDRQLFIYRAHKYVSYIAVHKDVSASSGCKEPW
jgi:hypothetical protein